MNTGELSMMISQRAFAAAMVALAGLSGPALPAAAPEAAPALPPEVGPASPPAAGLAAAPSDGKVAVGAVGFSGPAVKGSDQRRNGLFPLLEAEYQNRWFFGSTPATQGIGFGLHLLRAPQRTWDLGLGYGPPRYEHRADVLAGMGDRSGTLWLGSSARIRLGPLMGSVGLAHGLASGAGTRADLDLMRLQHLGGRWDAMFNAGAILADRDNMAYDYGITPGQARSRQALLASGDTRLRPGEAAAYAPGGGIKEYKAGCILIFSPVPRWHLTFIGLGTHLAGAAAASPLVRKADDLTVGIGFRHDF
jgi:outer membrane scaffolding protein for murein synthesis (MipA/OmpV family)